MDIYDIQRFTIIS